MNKDAERLLQECLAGLDAGLTPEECLSAWPGRRAELEPLLRQAMLLRVAYANAPSSAFQLRARDTLMFMAGREAREALGAQPDEAFVQRTRERLRNAAGAREQESLRAVPPPRLPFWVNARRRLLEAATARPAPIPSPQSPIFAFRSGLSAAVIVLAIAVAGLAYFTVQAPKPSVSAEFASLEQQLNEVEAQRNAGNPVPTDALVDLTKHTTTLVEKLDSAPSSASYDKAHELIERQKTLVQQAIAESPTAPPPALQQAQQQLSEASDRVQAARADNFTPTSAQAQPTLAASNAPAAPTLAPVAPTAAAATGSGAPATAAPSLGPIGPNEIRLRVVPGDNSFGTTWVEVATEGFRILIPSSWKVVGPAFDANGVGRFDVARLTFNSPDGVYVTANIGTGEVQALIGDNVLLLRAKTSLGGTRISVTNLVEQADSQAGVLSHMLDSVVHLVPTPTPSPSSTPTVAPSATQPPAPSVTPTP